METKTYEKKRGRVKKKVEAMRMNGLLGSSGQLLSAASSVNGSGLAINNLVNGDNSTNGTLNGHSPCSSVSEGLDLFSNSPLHGFQLSPGDGFRPRASSNASSCGGRLSPIPAAINDFNDPLLMNNDFNDDDQQTLSSMNQTFIVDPHTEQTLVELANSSMKLNSSCNNGANNQQQGHQQQQHIQQPQHHHSSNHNLNSSGGASPGNNGSCLSNSNSNSITTLNGISIMSSNGGLGINSCGYTAVTSGGTHLINPLLPTDLDFDSLQVGLLFDL